MRIGIIGAGNIGANCARRFVAGGKHQVTLSFSRDHSRLKALARELGSAASAGTAQDAVRDGGVVLISVPWDAIPEALRQAGPLDGKIVIDTTNQFGSFALPPKGHTAAAFNAARFEGSRYTKSFNTLTAGFQAETAERPESEKVVQWSRGGEGGDRGATGGAAHSTSADVLSIVDGQGKMAEASPSGAAFLLRLQQRKAMDTREPIEG